MSRGIYGFLGWVNMSNTQHESLSYSLQHFIHILFVDRCLNLFFIDFIFNTTLEDNAIVGTFLGKPGVQSSFVASNVKISFYTHILNLQKTWILQKNLNNYRKKARNWKTALFNESLDLSFTQFHALKIDRKTYIEHRNPPLYSGEVYEKHSWGKIKSSGRVYCDSTIQNL